MACVALSCRWVARRRWRCQSCDVGAHLGTYSLPPQLERNVLAVEAPPANAALFELATNSFAQLAALLYQANVKL